MGTEDEEESGTVVAIDVDAGTEGEADPAVDAEQKEGDLDDEDDIDLAGEASDDESPTEAITITCTPPSGYNLVPSCPEVENGALEGQHILVKWPEEDGGWVHAVVEKAYHRKNNAGKNYNVHYIDENVKYTHVLTEDTYHYDGNAPLESS